MLHWRVFSALRGLTSRDGRGRPPFRPHSNGAVGKRPGRPRFWRDALRRRMLALADLIAAAAASIVVASTSADAFWASSSSPPGS